VNEVDQEYGSFNFDWWGPSYDGILLTHNNHSLGTYNLFYDSTAGWGRAGLLNIDLSNPKLIYLTMQVCNLKSFRDTFIFHLFNVLSSAYTSSFADWGHFG
jgi:hypothetical protein